MAWLCMACGEELKVDPLSDSGVITDGWAIESRFIDGGEVRRIFHDPSGECEECGPLEWVPIGRTVDLSAEQDRGQPGDVWRITGHLSRQLALRCKVDPRARDLAVRLLADQLPSLIEEVA